MDQKITDGLQGVLGNNCKFLKGTREHVPPWEALISVACVAEVKRGRGWGRGRGNLSAREGERKGTRSPPPSSLLPRAGGTPIYGLYRYVPRNRVWFLRFSVLK